MSRYRKTTGELLEQVRMFEGKMKDIYNMAFAGDSAEEIAKKLKLDAKTVKRVLGEEIAMEKVERVPTGQYIVSYKTQDGTRKARVFDYRQHAHDFEKKLKSYGLKSEDWKDTNKRNVEKHGSTGKTSGEDRVKSLENEIQRLKLELENEKNATVKPEPNPDTGEVPLTVGVAHKYLKDKQKKEVKTEEIELDEATFNKAMVDKLKKAYEPLRGKRIAPEPLMKIFDKIDSNKDALITLYKADIPFVSTLAGSRLSQKHNLSPMDIKRIISKEEVQESVKFKYALVDTSKDNEVLSLSSDEKDLKMSVHHRNRGFLKIVKLKKPTTNDSMIGYSLKEETELTEYFATVHSDKKQIADFIKKNKSGIDYVDDDAGGNIEFEGKNAHELADKVKAKFGVRVTKESFEPIEDKSLDEMSLPSMNKPMTVKYTYTRNPDLFDKTLAGTKTGKKMKNVGPKLKGVYVLKGTGNDHLDFLKKLNSVGIMPTNKILGEELEEDTNKYITEKIKGLETKAKKTGMPYGILKKVYDRGMAAWKGGHRPGATQQQWAFARVNSFVTKSSGTWGKADKDLAQKVRAAESVEESRQLKDKEKEMMVVKNNKVIVIDKSDFEKYKSKGYIQAEDTENEACWDTHKQVGFKMKGGKRVPNCVPKNEELEEANLTDKQVDMVKKVADKLPKDDFKKRYGKDADNVKFGTATNIVKKKLNIDGYEGARNLVDRLLKGEK
jgi:hypothetical protein